ncbi:hypothetical protein COO59_14235 [Mixta theicola]|uniref:4'-phosphopantetheinyl transferase domain-containing protein n=1 Tax=Mixta theicola TaxID=1458355 RepID=A0A2K1Q7R9_9GAMM|nr:hypothetical protein [Mixta theicola]PNS11083.1 hypothetical protein COO59_14235 [Mixta theicola]GLR08430.1 hypothetical protein GCM10007905_11490 [Mixta theicola]
MCSWTDIWIAKIKETDEISILALLRKEDRKRYEQIIPPDRKRNFAFRRAVLDFVLHHYVNSYTIIHDAKGKPYIVSAEDSEKIFFSSSSSAELCVVAVSGEMIGVDLERKRQTVNLVSICDEYLAAFRDTDDIWKKSRVVKQLAACAWCRMESFIKLNGLTLHAMLFGKQNKLSDKHAEIISADTIITGDDYVCAISQLEHVESKNIYHISFEKIHRE